MNRLLVVDDEPNLAALVADALVKRGYECDVATSLNGAYAWLDRRSYAVVVCDLRLQDGDGLDLVRLAKRRYTDVGVVIMSAVDDEKTASRAIEDGAYGYLVKPVPSTQLAISVELALKRRHAEHLARLQHEELEDLVERRTSALLHTIDQLRNAAKASSGLNEELAHSLATACEFRGQGRSRHTHRVSRYSELIARSLSLPDARCEQLRIASILHDVGNVGVASDLLWKPGPLDPEEFERVQAHTLLGHQLLRRYRAPLLRVAADIALNHHERVDGSGYPNGAKAEDISLEARIVAVADVYDALTSERSHRLAWTADEAARWIRERSGMHFDVEVVDGFFGHFDEVLHIQREWADAS